MPRAPSVPSASSIALALAALLLGGACKKDAAPQARAAAEAARVGKSPPVPELSIDELAQQLAADAAQPVDANGAPTRKRIGTIPGAVLLSDYELFSLSELPADLARPLVFYCANEHCGASHEAAKRARFAGHTDVKVLPAGIAGWAKAGKPVAKI